MHALLSRILRPSIRLQLTLCYTVVFALLILASDIIFYTHLQTSLVDSLDAELHLRAQQIASDINDTDTGTLQLRDTTSDLPGFDPRYTNLTITPADVNFGTVARVLDSKGRLFRQTPAFQELVVPQVSVSQPLQGMPWQGTVTTRDGQEIRLYSRTMKDEEKIVAIIQVGVSLTPLKTMLQSVLLELLLIAPCVLLLSAVGSYWLASRAFRPIDHLTRIAQRIKDGDLHQRIPVSASRDEVQRLALTLNEMIDSLDKSFSRQRRFVADASHELRTPVAAIRSMTDIALLDPLALDNKYQHVLRTINSESERLGTLISDLLALARADEGQTHLEHEEVRLDVLIDAVAANAEALAAEQDVKLHLQASTPITVIGDEARLIQMAMNLLDNSLTYTPAGGEITLTAEILHGQACLSISDTGVGIPAEHLPHIFERFYRVDPAHARTEHGNSGLGLAIVEWVVRAHKGSISVRSQPGKGSTFTVLLPQVQSPEPTAPLLATTAGNR